jgi:hypothetical protein
VWSPFIRAARREPWNKGKVVGQKARFKLKDIWSIRIRLELGERRRELALFNLAIVAQLAAAERCAKVRYSCRINARPVRMRMIAVYRVERSACRRARICAMS